MGSCQDCPNKGILVPPDGPVPCPLAFVGEAPGHHEARQGKPFVGPAGIKLMSLMADIGLERKEVYITNSVKCLPNPTPHPEAIERCRPMLQAELDAVKPILIVVLGGVALQSLLPNTGKTISAIRGRIIWDGRRLYLPLLHPAAVLHNPGLAKEMKADFIRIPGALAKAVVMSKRR